MTSAIDPLEQLMKLHRAQWNAPVEEAPDPTAWEDYLSAAQEPQPGEPSELGVPDLTPMETAQPSMASRRALDALQGLRRSAGGQ